MVEGEGSGLRGMREFSGDGLEVVVEMFQRSLSGWRTVLGRRIGSREC